MAPSAGDRAAEQAELYLHAMRPRATLLAAPQLGMTWHARLMIPHPSGHGTIEGTGEGANRPAAVDAAERDLRIALGLHFVAEGERARPSRSRRFERVEDVAEVLFP